jgi:hypothetical protein
LEDLNEVRSAIFSGRMGSLFDATEFRQRGKGSVFRGCSGTVAQRESWLRPYGPGDDHQYFIEKDHD